MKWQSMTDHEDTLRLEGKLTAGEVADLDRRHRRRFDDRSPPVAVCLENVESGDSSVLALLLEWQARAQSAGQQIRFEDPPESLRVIARLTGVTPLLGWAEEDSNADSAREES